MSKKETPSFVSRNGIIADKEYGLQKASRLLAFWERVKANDLVA